jgi:hypothetical protein
MPFTVVFNDNGTIASVTPEGAKTSLTPISAAELPQILHNVTVLYSTITQIIIANSSGASDPCVLQGGDLYCW